MKSTVKLLTLLMALCLVLTLAACGDDRNNDDNDDKSKTSDSASTPAANTNSTITAPDLDLPDIKTETMSFTVDADTIKDKVVVTYIGDKITGITETVTMDSSDYTADQIEMLDETYDEMFGDFANHDCAHYSRTNVNNVYTIVLSFSGLDTKENADYVASLELFGEYKYGTTIAEFETIIAEAGYTKD